MLFDYNRFMYTRGNPLKYTDPTGHFVEDDIPLLCHGCHTWDDVQKFYGDEVYRMLKHGAITFGSIIFAGMGEEATHRYAFVLRGYYDGHKDRFRMAVWDMIDNQETQLAKVFAHERLTVWSTNTEQGNGGYFYTAWDKGFTSESAAEDWAQPTERGFNDFNISPKGNFTGYMVYHDISFRFAATMVGTWLSGKPQTPAAFGSLAIDLTDKGISLRDRAYLDRVYPVVYTGNEWVGVTSTYFSLWGPQR